MRSTAATIDYNDSEQSILIDNFDATVNIIEPDDAKELIDFSEMLLKIIYEFPSTANKKYIKKEPEKQEDKTDQDGITVVEEK